jgi:hypothetical protein
MSASISLSSFPFRRMPPDDPPDAAASPLRIGWREWAALPDLGVPGIKAKVDTGARTSALHVTDLEVATDGGAPVARFTVHPLRKRPEVTRACTAPVVDRRTVRSSSGDTQTRPIVTTTLALEARTWTVEVSLTRRDTMLFRMLLGRTALAGHCLIDPARSYACGRDRAEAYDAVDRGDAAPDA